MFAKSLFIVDSMMRFVVIYRAAVSVVFVVNSYYNTRQSCTYTLWFSDLESVD